MIRIVVHHSRTHESTEAATARSNQQSSAKNQMQSSRVQVNYQPTTQMSQQFDKMALHSRPTPKPRSSNNKSNPTRPNFYQRPRGSLSSCSSSSPELSGAEETEYCHQEQHLFPPLESNNDIKIPARRQRVNHNHKQLHTRSISLIVNPNFGASSTDDDDDDDEEVFACTNQPAGKYRRPRHNNYVQLLAQNKQVQPEVTATKSSNDQETEYVRLREIGFYLRQVSDEFARSRRLTI